MKKDVLHNQRIIRIDQTDIHFVSIMNYYVCPNCKHSDIEEDYNYCPKCGYQINWKSIDIDK